MRAQRVRRVGYTRYDRKRDPVDHVLDRVVPEEPGPAHSVPRWVKPGPTPREPEFLDSYAYARAICGATIKVVLPIDFDPGDPDGCQSCAAHTQNGTMAPPPPDDDDWYRPGD